MTKYREIWDERHYKFNSFDDFQLLKDVDWGNPQRKVETMDIIIYATYAIVLAAVIYSFIISR